MNNSTKIFFIVVLLCLSGVLGFSLSWYLHPKLQSKLSRETVHYPNLFVKELEGDPAAGRKIFKEFCGACHAKHPIINLNAPLIGNKRFWANKKIDALLNFTLQGGGAMPARGGCFECSDSQLREAISYIMSQSR